MTDTISKSRILTILNDQDVMTLRQKSLPVEFPLDKDTLDLIESLKKILVERCGLGMSAIQLGVPRRIFVMRKPWSSTNIITVINPKILRGLGRSVKAEGCFSVELPADRQALVARKSQIYVEYTDPNGTKFEEEFMIGMDARVFQHELQHLEGELMIDENTKYGEFVGISRVF
jgi:peptide deformylase